MLLSAFTFGTIFTVFRPTTITFVVVMVFCVVLGVSPASPEALFSVVIVSFGSV